MRRKYIKHFVVEKIEICLYRWPVKNILSEFRRAHCGVSRPTMSEFHEGTRGKVVPHYGFNMWFFEKEAEHFTLALGSRTSVSVKSEMPCYTIGFCCCCCYWVTVIFTINHKNFFIVLRDLNFYLSYELPIIFSFLHLSLESVHILINCT